MGSPTLLQLHKNAWLGERPYARTLPRAPARSAPPGGSSGRRERTVRTRRGLRGAVIYRKLSFGSQSEQGERTIERLLSASLTCRLRKQSLFTYLTHVLTAHARGDPAPNLP